VEAFFSGFNIVFDWVARGYAQVVRRVIRISVLMLLIYAGLIGAAAYLFVKVPQGFVPLQDQGVMFSAVDLPPGASLARTAEVVKRFEGILRDTPGVAHTAAFAGFSSATRTMSPSSGAVFFPLAPFEERAKLGLSANKLLGILRGGRRGSRTPTSSSFSRRRCAAWASAAASTCTSRTKPGADFQP
jgi:HAE1 family hydrophobic/amphiphilic exporter-1